MEEFLKLQLWQLLAAYIFIVLLLVIVRFRKLNREQEIVLATLRMTIQLILVAYLLSYIFEENHPLWTIGIIGVMEIFAINNIYKRVGKKISLQLKKIIAMAMALGTLSSIFYFIGVVIGLKPWYNARYFIPIAGMLVGNSMTGISLGVERLISGIEDNKDRIEASLMLGVTPKKATHDIVNSAFNAAILPTINSMMGMGIVFLPGMMTGQILAGASPLTAIRYQIAIMLGITGSVSLTVIIFLQLGYRSFFNQRAQLIRKEDNY